MKGFIFVMSMRLPMLFSLFIVFGNQILQAARPTVNASNPYSNNITCTSARFSWSNGNGNARMIVAREGNPVTFVPNDYNQYSNGSTVFGGSTPVGQNNDEYILINGVGMSAINVTNLKSGSTYYFAIYEHDNNGSNTLYLTAGSATYSFSTYFINPNFSITVKDSCEASNQFIFNNTSTYSVPGLFFKFIILGDTFNADQALTYSFKNINGKPPVTLINNNASGCPSNISKLLKIFPKKMVSYDFANSSDTIQEFTGNYYTIKTVPKMAPFPMSVSYQWTTGDGDSSFLATLKHTYTEIGRFKTRLITTASVNTKPTGCRDTQYLDLIVTGSKPFRNLIITPDTMQLSNNLFSFQLSDTLIKEVIWAFGDGDTSHQSVTYHTYKDTGNYRVNMTATTVSGKSATTTKLLRVNADRQDSSTVIDNPIVKELKIFPIPIVKTITLQFETSDWHEIEIMSLSGQIVYKGTSTKEQETIHTEEWPSGCYILSVLDKYRIFRNTTFYIVH